MTWEEDRDMWKAEERARIVAIVKKHLTNGACGLDWSTEQLIKEIEGGLK